MDIYTDKEEDYGFSGEEILKFGPDFFKDTLLEENPLPCVYFSDKVTAMARDPWWIFVYWRISKNTGIHIRKIIQNEGKKEVCSVLRIYNVTGKECSKSGEFNNFFDIELKYFTNCWYINTGIPKNSWCVDIGIICEDNSFFTLGRSNIVKTPPYGVSSNTSVKWKKYLDYWPDLKKKDGFLKDFRKAGQVFDDTTNLRMDFSSFNLTKK